MGGGLGHVGGGWGHVGGEWGHVGEAERMVCIPVDFFVTWHQAIGCLLVTLMQQIQMGNSHPLLPLHLIIITGGHPTVGVQYKQCCAWTAVCNAGQQQRE